MDAVKIDSSVSVEQPDEDFDIKKIFSPELDKTKKSNVKKLPKKKGEVSGYTTLHFDPSARDTSNDTANLVQRSSDA
jgi:hypothetical protein